MRTVVITRPKQQAKAWIDAFEQLGYPVVHFPLLEIVPARNIEDIKKRQEAWANITNWTWVMFVSPNAVEHFFEQAQNTPWPAYVRAGSPGEGTTQALVHAGVPLELIDQPTPEQEKDTDCLWANIQHRNWQGTRVLLVRGQSAHPPRDWLMEQLKGAGALVQPLAVYLRQPCVFSETQKTWLSSSKAKQACWIISSSESLHAITGYDWAQATAIVIHPRIAQTVRQVGFGRIICTQPDLASLVDSVGSVV